MGIEAGKFGKLTSDWFKQNATEEQASAMQTASSGVFGMRAAGKMREFDAGLFQGDVQALQENETLAGKFSEEEITAIHTLVDTNSDGVIDADEAQALAQLGEGLGISDADNVIDEQDFFALYEIAYDCADDLMPEEEPVPEAEAPVPTEETPTAETPTTGEVVSTGLPEVASRITDADASARAAELNTAMRGWDVFGTGEAKVNDILLNSGYNSAEILQIMNAYEEAYGKPLMQDIQHDFSGGRETALRETLYGAVEYEAQQNLGWGTTDDIPEDIVTLANEYYQNLESADATGYMGQFSKLDPGVQAQVLIAADMLHPDETAMSRLTEDRVWFGAEDGYVKQMLGALQSLANGENLPVKPEEAVTVPSEAVTTPGEEVTTPEEEVTTPNEAAANTTVTVTTTEGVETVDAPDEVEEADAAEPVDAAVEDSTNEGPKVMSDAVYNEFATKVDELVVSGMPMTDAVNSMLDKFEAEGYSLKEFTERYDGSHATPLLQTFGDVSRVDVETMDRFAQAEIDSYGGAESPELIAKLDELCYNDPDNPTEEWKNPSYLAQLTSSMVYEGLCDTVQDPRGEVSFRNYTTSGWGGNSMSLQEISESRTEFNQMLAVRDEYYALSSELEGSGFKFDNKVDNTAMFNESEDADGNYMCTIDIGNGITMPVTSPIELQVGNKKISKIQKEGLSDCSFDRNASMLSDIAYMQAAIQQMREYKELSTF